MVRVSRIAVISAVCALAGPFCLAASFFLTLGIGVPYVLAVGAVVGVILCAAAVVLALISGVQIGLSGGRFAGYAYVVVGAGIPLGGLLMALFLVATSGVSGGAYRMRCGTNLSGIGKAMLVYANDYGDVFPRAGGADSRWVARTPWWVAQNAKDAYGLSDPNATDGRASISACLYLLIKCNELAPKSFVCPGDKATKKFEPSRYGVGDKTATELWDFGPNPPRHCSYAYHMVHGEYPLTSSMDPSLATAADRNPWMDSPFARAKDFSLYRPDVAPFNGTAEQARNGNATAHDGDGQQVLYLDSHVEFNKRACAGPRDDNIYTYWDGNDRTRGLPPKLGSAAAGPSDSLLVNDPAVRED